MLVEEKIIDGKVRLDFKYKIQSGPSPIKNYGLALARALRFPSSMIERADELINKIEEESIIPFLNERNSNDNDNDDSMMDQTTRTSNEIDQLEREVVDLHSFVLLLMSTDKDKKFDHVSIEIINEKLRNLIDLMTPNLRELLQKSSIDEILGILNSSKSFDGTFCD